ncbi:MAG: hypothetical protein J3Q66DRAFT_340601 [Benniella sp.]|nr:MAG: hypothetical protein J3Q66DRAFT_340601 [Benniella sp.]
MSYSTHDDGDQDDILISTMRSLELANRKTAIAEHELSASRSDQARLEERVFELDSSLTEARKEVQRLSRAKKESDRELEQSNSALEKERTQWAEREAELNRSLKFATRPLIVQAPKKEKEKPRLVPVKESIDKEIFDKETVEPEPVVDVIPPHIQQQIAETNAANTRALRAHEKMVAELRRQIIAMNQDMIETKQTFRLRESELQAEINQAQELNSNLMEENESFQLLLHEKSINGEFMQTSIMKNTNYEDDDDIGTPLSTHNPTSNLADEIGKALGQLSSSDELLAQVSALEEEKKSLEDGNKALKLYISKILNRIMDMPGFTAVLNADYVAPQPTIKESRLSVPPASKGKGSTDNTGSEGETRRDMRKQETKQNRPRSHSVLPFFNWARSATPPASGSGKSSNRNSSEDEANNNNSLQDRSSGDSPRGSSENATTSMDPSDLLDYEPLTTFDQPYSREQLKLQRHASIGSRDRQRRQTIGGSGAVHANGHGRFGSGDSSNQGRRSLMPPKSLPPMPESQRSMILVEETMTITEDHDTDDITSAGSPALSVSTSLSSSTSNIGTPTTPVVAEGGVLKVFRRLSMFGGSPNNSVTTVALPPTKADDDTPQ